MTCDATRRWPTWLALALGGAALLRLVSLGRLALTDNTESRYASIAWEMFSSGDWVTPRVFIHGELVPFWGKPPLGFWLTSLAYHVFGVSEWSARVPSFLLAVATVAATMAFASQVWGRRVAMLSGVVLASTGFFLILAGACVLDVPLMASVSGAMLAFARFAESAHRRLWGVAFFFALAVGMLAKGPVAVVLVGLALALWMAAVGRWRLLLQLPWISGWIVFLAIAAPWYILAERATPGFLHYFIVHEHFLRYVTHEYGDLYGSGRQQPFGTAWAFLFVVSLPWSAIGIAAMVRLFRGRGVWPSLRGEPWLAYALVWGLTPALFFTPARQILMTYLAPGLAGLALATAVALDRWMAADPHASLNRWLKWHIAMVGVAAVGGAVAATIDGQTMAIAAALPIAVACVIWLARPVLRDGSPDALVGVLGLTTATALATTVFVIEPIVNDRNSAKVILAEVYRDPAAKQRPVVTPLDSKCSPLFYAQAMFGGCFVYPGRDGSRLMSDMLDRRGNELFLFARHEFDDLAPETAARLRPVAETRYWIACEGKYGE